MSHSITRLLVYALASLVLILLAVILRLGQVIHATHSTDSQRQHAAAAQSKSQRARLAVFLGSGGHTGEMIRLLVGVDFHRYTDRLYVIADGDALSLAKANELEKAKQSDKDDKPVRPAHKSVSMACSDGSRCML